MGKDTALAFQTTALPVRAASGSRLQSAGGHFVGSAQWGPVAGFDGGVFLTLDLLAAEGMGRERGVAHDLAGGAGGVK